MITFPFKLVRDNVPAIVQEKGGWCITKQLQGEEYRRALGDKVREEAIELCAAKTTKDKIVELADLLEVIEAYRFAHGIGTMDITHARGKRGITRGLFGKGIKLYFAISSGRVVK